MANISGTEIINFSFSRKTTKYGVFLFKSYFSTIVKHIKHLFIKS